jgi:hypothetical protein
LTIRGGGNRQRTWHRCRRREWARRPGALPPMRMTASWSGSKWTYRIQVRGVKMRRNGELPSDRYADIQQARRLSFEEIPLSLFIVPPRAQASRRCETQATLGGKPPSLLAFRSLDPFRALREPDRRRRDEERPPAPNKELAAEPKNNRLTGRAPYKSDANSFLEAYNGAFCPLTPTKRANIERRR